MAQRKSAPNARKSKTTFAPARAQEATMIEDDNDDDGSGVPEVAGHKYETRTAKYGRGPDSYEKYDQKFHPADWDLRPTRAAKRRGVCSLSRSPSTSTIAEDDEPAEATDEESLPSSAEDVASQQDSNEDSGDESNTFERQPDPKASRSSTRPQAQKYVNYSAAHHKDDSSIPGFQHRARQLKRPAAIAPDKETSTKIRRLGRIRKPSAALGRSHDSDVNDLVEQTLLNLEKVAPSTARVSARSSGQIDSISKNEGADERKVSARVADPEPNHEELPRFAKLQDEGDGDRSLSESNTTLDVPSTDIDETIITFTQIQTSDSNDATSVPTSERVAPLASDLARGVIEATQDVIEEAKFDSSRTLRGLIVSQGQGQGQGNATSSVSKADNSVDNQDSKLNSTQQVAMVLQQTAQDNAEGSQGLIGNAEKQASNALALQDGEISDQSSTYVTAVDASASSRTLQGDVVPQVVEITSSSSLPRRTRVTALRDAAQASEVEETPQHSALVHENGGYEQASSLQALLEQDIAASQMMANSSSSDMLM